mgnify:FL=1
MSVNAQLSNLIRSFLDGTVQSPEEEEGASLSETILDFVAKGIATRPRNVFRASGVYYLCPRQEAYRLAIPAIERGFDAKSIMIFDVGHAVHKWFQEQYLGPMGILVGHWDCPKCQHQIRTLVPVRSVCPRCQTLMTYTELELTLPGTGVIGHTDGLIAYRQSLWVLDIKTINKEGMAALSHPIEANVYQLQGYVSAVEPSLGLRVVGGILLYICKDNSTMKDFEIAPDPAVLLDIQRKVDISQQIIQRRLPADPRSYQRECSSKTCYRARGCAWAAKCFSDPEPGDV